VAQKYYKKLKIIYLSNYNLVYGAEVWQILTREIYKILSTEMDVLRRLARKSRMERMKNDYIKEIMG
jgi:TRAP-type C4-dicarboxylate transport system substrate-binding protein